MTKNKQKTAKKGLMRTFIGYYKPYVGAFSFDMACALLMALCNLVYPYLAGDIIDVYAPQGDWKTIAFFGGVKLTLRL